MRANDSPTEEEQPGRGGSKPKSLEVGTMKMIMTLSDFCLSSCKCESQRKSEARDAETDNAVRYFKNSNSYFVLQTERKKKMQ